MRRAVVAGGGGFPADSACHVLQLLRQLIAAACLPTAPAMF